MVEIIKSILNQKGSGHIILVILIIVGVLGGGFYLKNQIQKTPVKTPKIEVVKPSPTPTPHPEAKSLEIPKNHSRIKWKTTPVTEKEPIYLHFSGKEFGSEVPLVGKEIEGVITDNPENNTLIEDYYRSNLEKQGWVRKILQIPGYQLGIRGPGMGGIYCLYRDTYVYMGYKDDAVRLIKITSGLDPDLGCSEMAPVPSVLNETKNIKYRIFISDPLPIEVIRQKEFEIS